MQLPTTPPVFWRQRHAPAHFEPVYHFPAHYSRLSPAFPPPAPYAGKASALPIPPVGCLPLRGKPFRWY